MELTIEELKKIQDLEFGSGEWLSVGQARVSRFAETTEDEQWIHLDPERASTTPFGGTIAHGYLVLSLVPKMLFELVRVVDAAMVVNLGIDKLRFLHPVPSDAEIRLRGRLVSGQERNGGVLFRVRVEIEVAPDGRRAAVGELLFLAMPEAEEGT